MADNFSSEQELIEDIKNGDRNKYGVLVDRYSPMVFHIVRRFENDEEEVEELAQQIFVKVYTRLDSFNRQSKFSSWLYMVAKNHCRDYAKNIRRQNKRFSEMETVELEEEMPKSELPDSQIEADEWSRLLETALDRINGDNAKAFLMKYRDNMTYKAMSKRLDVSVSALKVRVHRARKELKEYIEQKSDTYG